MTARRPLAIALAAAAGLACAGASGAAGDQHRARASFRFGITGGNIVPFTATISRRGEVTYARGGVRSRRPPLTVAAVDRLLALARAERFYSLPASITCPGVLPDVGTEFVTIRTAQRSKTVRERGSCSRRFAKVYARLGAAAGTR